MVRPERFELPTCCSGGNRSIQLSYGRIAVHYTSCWHQGRKRRSREAAALLTVSVRSRLGQIDRSARTATCVRVAIRPGKVLIGRVDRELKSRWHRIRRRLLQRELSPRDFPGHRVRTGAAIAGSVRKHTLQNVVTIVGQAERGRALVA